MDLACIHTPPPLLPLLQESGVVVDERQVAQVMTMLANNYNSPKGQGDDGELSSALTSSLFSTGEGKVCGTDCVCMCVGQEEGGGSRRRRRETLV